MNGTISLLERLPTTRDDLLRAAQIIREVILSGNVDTGHLEARFATEVPVAAPLIRLLRDPATGTVIAALGVILAVLLALLGNDGQSTSVTNNINITTVSPDTVDVQTDSPVPTRRSPCHCGSGKRYKNCHGREPSAAERQKAEGSPFAS
ncbi:hypothetical protein GS905_24685 [Rhodococcus hoagii]|nr:hypothetical protein [Prescottella equi]NKT24528.1 hypothetical protein [Prescottella equi]NKU71503.1 hypothetical protein [Prescottella equi]